MPSLAKALLMLRKTPYKAPQALRRCAAVSNTKTATRSIANRLLTRAKSQFHNLSRRHLFAELSIEATLNAKALCKSGRALSQTGSGLVTHTHTPARKSLTSAKTAHDIFASIFASFWFVRARFFWFQGCLFLMFSREGLLVCTQINNQ